MGKIKNILTGVAIGAGAVATFGALVELLNIKTVGYGKEVYNNGEVKDITNFKDYMTARKETLEYSCEKACEDFGRRVCDLKGEAFMSFECLKDGIENAKAKTDCRIAELKEVIKRTESKQDIEDGNYGEAFTGTLEDLFADGEENGLTGENLEAGFNSTDEVDRELQELDDIDNDENGDLK